MMWLRLLGISFILFCINACNKEKNKMNVGYYEVTDIRTYLSGTIDTINYQALGPIGENENGTSISFSSDTSFLYSVNSFDLDAYSCKSIDMNSTYINFSIIDYTKSNTQLKVNRIIEDNSYQSSITYNYIK